MNPEKDIIILPCTAKKENIGLFYDKLFTVNCKTESEVHPYDIVKDNITWYDLVNQNQNNINEKLLEAYKLYKPNMHNLLYQQLYDIFGERFLIYSAGWGLIKASYRLPYYNITFNGSSKKDNHRGKKDSGFRDMNQGIEILNKYPEAKIYIILSNNYMKNIGKFFEEDSVKNREFVRIENPKTGGSNYTWVYRWCTEHILNGVCAEQDFNSRVWRGRYSEGSLTG